MPTEPLSAESSARRREGRALACEGLMASHFGRRPSQAGVKAIQELRASQVPGLATELSPVDEPIAHAQDERAASWDWWQAIFTRWFPRPIFAGSRSWAAMAVCLVFLLPLIFIAYVWMKPQAGVAVLSVNDSGVRVERQGKPLAGINGFSILPGDVIQTAKHSQATLHFRNTPAHLVLREATEFKVVAREAGWKCEVRRGSVVAEIGSASSQKPMVFTTPQAEARVTGTHFILAVKRFSTWLDVIEGQVTLRRLEDGAATEVGARHYAVAANGLELSAIPEDQRWQTPYSLQRSRKGAS